MRVLVTGGAGFIGSAVCRHLVGELNLNVFNIDKLTYASNLRSLEGIAAHQCYAFKQIDICNRDAMQAAFDNFQPDAVIHLAAESHVDRSITGSAAFIGTNIVGTYTLLETARAYWSALPPERACTFRFLHVSTDEVYGSLGADDGLFREETPYDPSSPYSASKAASDHLALAWHRTYGLPVLIANCSNNYGPFQFPEKLIPLMILNAWESKTLPVYGDGANVRDWLYVDDNARALIIILQRGRIGEKYNIGCRNEQTNLRVVEHRWPEEIAVAHLAPRSINQAQNRVSCAARSATVFPVASKYTAGSMNALSMAITTTAECHEAQAHPSPFSRRIRTMRSASAAHVPARLQTRGR